MNIAIVDLGTNSIRFDVYKIKKHTELVRIHRSKKMIRMGEKVFKSGRLSEKAMARAEKAIQDFFTEMENEKIDKVVAFSTCALREAENATEFIHRIEAETGIHFEVISGKEEARLISKGILSNKACAPKGLYALVDIGGGSTEMSLCYKRTVLEQDSAALGSSRLTQLFAGKTRKEMRKYIKEELAQKFIDKKWGSVSSLVGSSGTAKAIAKLATAQNMPTEPLNIKGLNQIISDIKNLSPEELALYPGMEPKRIDIIVAGGVLLQEIARYMGAKEIHFTEYNLRDGILEEFIEGQLKGVN